MKKFLLSIFAVMLAVFSVQAQDVVLDFTTNDWGFPESKVEDGKTHTYANADGYAITVVAPTNFAYYPNGNYFLFGKTGAVLTLPVFDFAVSKIEIIGRNGASTSVKEGLYAGDTKLTQFTGAAETNTFEIPVANQAAGIVYSIKVESNHNAQITKIKIYKAAAGGETPEPDQPETPAAPAAPTLTASCNFDGSMNVAITNIAEDATAYYTTDGTTPSATNGTEYTGSFEITATTTVKAIAVNEGGASDVVSATYTKNEPVDPNAKEVEATISFASTTHRVSQDNNKQVWANGGVTFTNNKSKSTSNVGNYSNPVRLYASSEVVVECASMTKIVFVCNSASYATTLKNSIGNDATVSNSNVTVTFANPVDKFTVASLTGQVRLNSLTVTYVTTEKVVKAPAITPESCGFYAGDVVEVTMSAEEGTIYYTLDGNDPTTLSEVYSDPIIVSETTTVKAIAVVDDTESEVATAVYKKGIDGTVADAFVAYVDGERLPVVVTGYIVGYVNGNAVGDAGENCVFDAEGCELKTNILIANDPYETDYMKCLAVQLPNNDIRAALNLVDNSDNLNKKVVVKGSLEKYLGIAGLKDIVVGELVEEPSYTLTVGETEWATLYLDFAVTIPAGVEVWTVEDIVDGYVVLGEVLDVIPARCPVLVKASMSGDYEFAYTAGTGNEYVNLLQGTATATYITDDAYVLTADDTSEDGVCFGRAIKNQLDGTAWLNNANKAYLPASKVPAEDKSLSFRFPGTTGIEEVTEQRAESKEIYDLTGRKLKGENGNLKGIYIINGKKVLVK